MDMDIDNNSENISFLLNDDNFNKDSYTNECELLELYKLQSELNDYETGVNYFGNESENTDDIFTQMKLYELNYNVKQLMLICEYYNILKDVRVNKLKKQDIIEQIIFFENNTENIEIVNKRKEFWCYMDELKNDKIMKRFVIWS
jgi:hypothetical protein